MKKITVFGDLPHNSEISLEIPTNPQGQSTIHNINIQKQDTPGKNNVHAKLKKNGNVLVDTESNITGGTSEVVSNGDKIQISLKNNNINSTERGHKIEIEYDGDSMEEGNCKIFFTPSKVL